MNRAHYARETDYYSVADLRDTELALAESLPDSVRVLDVGCGAGRVVNRLRDRDISACGIDINNVSVAAARDIHPSLPAVVSVADMCSLPFADSTFDEVWCLRYSFNALPTHIERLAAMSEMARVCRKSGRVVIESFNLWYPGRLGFYWLSHATRVMSRAASRLGGDPTPPLPYRDIIYLPSKGDAAAPGYAHIASPTELRSLVSRSVPSAQLAIRSAPGVSGWILCTAMARYMRYSIWLELTWQ